MEHDDEADLKTLQCGRAGCNERTDLNGALQPGAVAAGRGCAMVTCHPDTSPDSLSLATSNAPTIRFPAGGQKMVAISSIGEGEGEGGKGRGGGLPDKGCTPSCP